MNDVTCLVAAHMEAVKGKSSSSSSSSSIASAVELASTTSTLHQGWNQSLALHTAVHGLHVLSLLSLVSVSTF
jgi:hypothetical protein